MTSNVEGLNYFPFLTKSQKSPPTSSRTMPSPCGSGGGERYAGGQTTRRSLPRNLHGNYEGDYSMFTSRTNQVATGSLMDQILEAGLDLRLEQHFGAATAAQEEPLDDETDEVVDEEIRAKMAEIQASKMKPSSPIKTPRRPSLWHCYKRKIFSSSQCQKIDATLATMEKHPVLRQFGNSCKFAAFMISCVLRLLLYNVLMRAVNLSCLSAANCRNMLRKAIRHLLWRMTLAKCGEVQLFGLVILLSPLLFVIAILGLVFALYCVIKQGTQSLIRQMRYMDIDMPPQLEVED